ncbi:MAG: hypothetical protein LBP36_02430 [Oscillospiraceae bacterium]|jgi:hypothetical protein|nr:hypothetical protein [Oscillospiraceae bacterium]
MCKNCGCCYTKSKKHGYSERKKREAIRYYNEGIGFRRIERLLGMSHVSVINWVKKKKKSKFWSSTSFVSVLKKIGSGLPWLIALWLGLAGRWSLGLGGGGRLRFGKFKKLETLI